MPRSLPLTAVAVLLVLAGAAATATARAVLGPPGPDRPRLVLDADGPLFGPGAATDLVPGARRRACATVRNPGPGAVRPALRAERRRGALAPFLTLTVTRGAGGAGGAGDGRGCAAFAPAAVLFRGPLSELPATPADPLVDATVLPAGAARTYRFALELGDDPDAAGRVARWDWRLAVTPAPPVQAHAASTGAPCTALALPGAGPPRARVLVRTVRIAPRVHAVLRVRVLGRPAAQRLVLTTGLRVRGRTLRIAGWAGVRYAVGRDWEVSSAARPFRVRARPGVLRRGRNAVAVTIRPRRGPVRSARFVVRALAGRDAGGGPACTLR